MASAAPQVPEELIQRLHDATERLRAARLELEHWMAASEYRHQERVNIAEDRFRQAERELEEIDREISDALQGKAESGAS